MFTFHFLLRGGSSAVQGRFIFYVALIATLDYLRVAEGNAAVFLPFPVLSVWFWYWIQLILELLAKITVFALVMILIYNLKAFVVFRFYSRLTILNIMFTFSSNDKINLGNFLRLYLSY